MKWLITEFKNAPFNQIPTISIKSTNPEFDAAYQNWIIGKNPTNSPEWTKGVFAVCGGKNPDTP